MARNIMKTNRIMDDIRSTISPEMKLQMELSTTMDIQELLNRTDRFAANAGCRITEVDGQHAVAQMTVTAMHLNGGNVCQGGALFTLADLAMLPG